MHAGGYLYAQASLPLLTAREAIAQPAPWMHMMPLGGSSTGGGHTAHPTAVREWVGASPAAINADLEGLLLRAAGSDTRVLPMGPTCGGWPVRGWVRGERRTRVPARS